MRRVVIGELYVYAEAQLPQAVISKVGKPAIALAVDVDWDYETDVLERLKPGDRVAIALYSEQHDVWRAGVAPPGWLHSLAVWRTRGGDVVRAPVSRWPKLSRQTLDRDRAHAIARLAEIANLTR